MVINKVHTILDKNESTFGNPSLTGYEDYQCVTMLVIENQFELSTNYMKENAIGVIITSYSCN